MDPTVDPAIRSFLAVAPESHFPLQNLPYGVFSPTPAAGRRIARGSATGSWTSR